MSRHKLSAREVETTNKPGRYSDGDNLYLSVSPNGGKRWVFLYRWQGRPREMGLGSAKGSRPVSLAAARALAEDARKLLSKRVNPLDAKRADAEAGRKVPTFGECADEYISGMEDAWRNEKHRAQWRMTLTEYAADLRSKPVNVIDTEAVLKVLQPIWKDKAETASRLRGRIERVLDAARAKGHRSGENPAAWRGHLKNLLPARQKLTRGHHAAMPYVEVPAFIGRLRERDAIASQALEFVILTAARTGEVLGARWSEIDLPGKVWTVPAERMKAGREHRVPLSSRAVAILEHMATAGAAAAAFVFPGNGKDRPLSSMAMDMLLRRMDVAVTVHGFRSSFRDWAGERSTFPREVAEAALAHVVGDATERAYRRGDALEKRRKLMDAWAGFLEPKASNNNVVQIPAKRA